MKFLKYAGSFALVLLFIFFTNNAFAQGQGKGKGKGLVENRGIQNGEGFTTGQGHLNGNSAVDLGPGCIEEVIAFFDGIPQFFNPIQISPTEFTIIQRVEVPAFGFCFLQTHYVIVSRDENGSCIWMNQIILIVPC